jgi:tetratricopeptide (TPR) repeat protein
LWQVPIFFLGLAALVGVCLARPTWREGDLRQLERDLNRVHDLLEQHRSDTGQLAASAERLIEQVSRHPERAAEIHFQVGAAYVRIAERDPAASILDAWNKARYHLEEAQTLGVPESEILRLTYLHAKTLFHTKGDPQDIIEELERSIEGGADQPAEGYAMLTQAYLQLPTRDVEAALRANEKELAVPYVGDDLLAPARLLRGEILLELKRTDEARKVLAHIGVQAPPIVLARARWLRAFSFQQEEHWDEASILWKEALEDRAAPPRDPANVLYNLGLCYRRLDKLEEAAQAWTECMQRGDAGEAGAAAAIHLAELRLSQQETNGLLEALENAVREIKSPADWHNPLVELNKARDVFDAACDWYRKQGRFEEALRLAHLYEPLATPGAAQMQVGRVAYAWAEQTRATAEGQKAKLEEAAGRFRQAGEAFAKAAELSTVPADQAGKLWSAIQSYAQASEPAKTITAVERLFALPREGTSSLDGAILGKAWYLRAEAHRALGDETLAQYSFGECIQFRSEYAYRARLHLALAEAGKNKLDEARSMLEQNLRLLREEEKPDQEALERTLFALARLLYESHDYAAAETYYKQALDKFHNNPDMPKALHQLADCYRVLAEEEARAVAQDTQALPAAKTHHEQQFLEYMKQAAQRYQELADEMTKRSQKQSLTAEEEALCWQAHINAALCRYQLGHYAEAKGLYEQLASRYQDRTRELYALRGIARCYWSMGGAENTALAAQTLEKIRVLLARLSDADLNIGPDSWTRQTWQQWLDQVSKAKARQ